MVTEYDRLREAPAIAKGESRVPVTRDHLVALFELIEELRIANDERLRVLEAWGSEVSLCSK